MYPPGTKLDPIASCGRRVTRWYDRRAVVLGAFLVGLAVSAAGATVAVVRGLTFWRQTKRTGRTFTSELESFEQKASRTERHLAEWEKSSAGLDEALARLRVSRARLRVLQDALDQAQARVRWLRVFVPR
jgi:exonuclease VII small subunit